ncbi:hypothetical protein LK996_14525 [Lysobacter sp. A6]|uniref:STAS/SEC14 domain-containing protein n=1 Tax=Noviluteimonas lactosilytica TaxID=2888523 RepID=A0ABS8JLH7_9GAMM|nr:hypothetical protein [Lysobacter lactosilyticus]MCC8364288.1 hypothetical protein [Lysobacter lactosilyticus]
MGNGDYKLKLVHDGDGLWATVTGTRSVANTAAYWEAILAEVLRQRPRWLYVDDRMKGAEIAIGEWFALVDAMKGRGLEGLRIAHVKPVGVNHLEYCEIFAREAGLEARAFSDPGTAERWLRYGVPEETR